MIDLLHKYLTEKGLTLEKEYRFHPVRRWRFDYCIKSKMVALEIEGAVYQNGRHQRASGFLKDMEKYNEAAIMGWFLIRVTPQDVEKNKEIELIDRILNENDRCA